MQKLRLYREGGEVSDRQWRDIVSALRTQARRIDIEYLAGVAETTDLGGLLARARRDAGA